MSDPIRIESDLTREDIEDRIQTYLSDKWLHGTGEAPPPVRLIWTPARLNFKATYVGLVTVVILFLAHIAFTIVFAVNGAFNLSYFTLWGFTLGDIYYFVLILALIFQHWLWSYTVLLLFPLKLGTSIFIAYAIIIIIWNDATALIKGTVCDTPAGDMSIETLHTGEWIAHGFTVFADLLSTFVLAVFIYTVFQKLVNRMSDTWQWIYFVYFMGCSLILLGIYQLTVWTLGISLDDKYPTSFETWQRIFIILGLNFTILFALWLIVMARQDAQQIHVYLFKTRKQRLNSR